MTFSVEETDKSKALAYFQKVSANYDDVVSDGILAYPRKRERAAVLELANLSQPGKSLLDAGCGAGFYALIGKKNGMIVTAVDAAPGMIESLKNRVDEAHVGDLEQMHYEAKFDTVVCAGVLDFVRTPEVAFANLARAVKPGGRLVILCPRRGLGGLFYRLEKWYFGFRVNLYSRTWFQQEALKHGLRLVEWRKPLPTNMALRFEKTTR